MNTEFDGKNHIDSLEAFTKLVRHFPYYSEFAKHCIEKYVVESKAFYLPYETAHHVPKERKVYWEGRYHESNKQMKRYAAIWDFIPEFGILTCYGTTPLFSHEFCHMLEIQDESRILQIDFNLPIGLDFIKNEKKLLASLAREVRVRALEEKFFMPKERQDRISSFLDDNCVNRIKDKKTWLLEMGEHFKSQWSEKRFEETIKKRIDFIVSNIKDKND
jgi:hypothetical protein